MPLVVAVPLVVVSGYLTRLAFPDPGWWPCAVLGVAGLTLALASRRTAPAAGLGLLYGLAYFVPLLHWSGVYVGAMPWLALSGLQAAYLALMAIPIAWVTCRPGWGAGRSIASTVVIAGLWTAQEALRDRTPFGGFPWGRLAFSQSDSPMVRLAALGGAPLVTFAVAWSGAALATCALLLLARRRGVEAAARRSGAVAALTLALGAAVVLVGLLVPLPTNGTPVRVAGIQGDVPEAGLDFNAERRAVLDNHARVTNELATQVAAGQAPQPDVVIWPENASDLDPYQQADARQVIDEAVDRIGAPTLVGAVLERPAGFLTNASIVWEPGTGPTQLYVKRHPVPFGEYIPHRAFFRKFSTKVDLVREDFVAGHVPGLLQLGPTRAGVAICFEVAYDNLLRDSVRGGADLLVVQTNNATFGYTDEAVQQLAMSRLRAIEHGRSVAHISTVGESALIEPDGRMVAHSDLFTPAMLQATLPRRTATTIADRLGVWAELALVMVGLLGAAALVLGSRGSRPERQIGSAPGAGTSPALSDEAPTERAEAG
ncbi:apolipoprotein N-acyltransferase [Angustibacter sp. McL0619]|uniref:apolipoprotein N-acyltransferase n=1 Tax=Angustibacter sp. McL0619 TaxID=3415676 RepID=UPI003CF1C3F3